MAKASKIALVTGGGSGIGKAVALQLASMGIKTAIAGRTRDKLTAVSLASEAKGLITPFAVDVSAEQEITRLVAEVTQQLGPIDILVNNAGMHARNVPLHEHKTSTWDKTMNLNLRTPFLLAREVLPSMRDRNFGHIINIGSDASVAVGSTVGAYCVSKQGLVALTKLIRIENEDHNVRAHIICPGLTDTDLASSMDAYQDRLITPETVGHVVRWLLDLPDFVAITSPIVIESGLNPWKSGEPPWKKITW